MTTDFSQMGLQPELMQAISDLGFSEPTPIQSSLIPVMLTGQDVIGQAQTGTGKTAAFGLPILHNIVPNLGQVQCLIVAPTRELAMQVARALEDYGRHFSYTVLAVYGGQPYGHQKRSLRRGVEIVVGTPGRLIDLMKQGALDVSHVRTVVLDEADEMLSMGFVEDMEEILKHTPEDRQTALFSATMPQEIRRLADKYLKNPQSITIQRKQLTAAAIEQRYYLANEYDKLAVLTRLFEVEDISSALIFARTRVGTGELANELTVRGFPAEALNGDLNQDARERVLNRFRQGQIKVLVATDVAARGLDIEDISHVFNFDLPTDPEIFVHRVGRTGRAGKTGIAISLATPKEMFRIRKIERLTRQNMTQMQIPTVQEIQEFRETQLVTQMVMWLNRGRCRRERDIVEDLIEKGEFDAVEIASAALKLARAEEKQRPIASVSEVVADRSRNGRDSNSRNRRSSQGNGRSSGSNGSSRSSHGRSGNEKGMVRLSLSAGKAQGIRPGDVVGTIAFHADIPGRAIGAIRIQEQHTFVDVPEQYVSQVLEKNGSYRLREQKLAIEKI